MSLQPHHVDIGLRGPFPAGPLLDFLAARAVPGVERVDGRNYSRTMRLPSGVGTVTLTMPEADAAPVVTASFRLEHSADLAAALAQCRSLLDADADPARIDATLAADPALAGSVAACPGLRLPGAVDGPEILIRALFGQQISVTRARVALGELTVRAADVLDAAQAGDSGLTHLFPSPAAISDLGARAFAGPRQRVAAITAAASALATGALVVAPGRSAEDLTADLVAMAGIGPWTAGYVAMRALADRDVLLIGDVAQRRGAAALGLPEDPAALLRHAEMWRPYRSYAGMHLWRNAPPRAAPRRRSR